MLDGNTSARIVALLVVAMLLPFPSATAQSPEPLRVGITLKAIDELRADGVRVTYGSWWVGEWMEQAGWSGFDRALQQAVANDVTPVVYWYYWGDSISPECVENGCNSREKSEWFAFNAELAESIRANMGGREVLVVVENEFNKGGVTADWYAPTFDGYLERIAKELKAVPGVKIVAGYGAWGEDSWSRFPKLLAQSDYVGFQMMRASTRNTEEHYRAAADRTRYFSAYVAEKFGKPSFLYDLALSSYPDAHWERVQAETLQAVLESVVGSREIGLQGVVYRTLRDNPDMSPENHYGYAEQHWGFKRADGSSKPAYLVWRNALASSAPVPPIAGSFEGEDMRPSTGGRRAMTEASGGAVWNVWANGQLAQRVESPGGRYDFAIVAGGTPASGVDPAMELRVDGAAVARWSVRSGALATYTAQASVAAGAREITVHFTNDVRTATEDRNLYVDVVRIQASNQAPVASFEARASGLSVDFDAGASWDPEGDALAYAWDFGDGNRGTGPTARHRYAVEGAYAVTLTVSDGRQSDAATRSVTVVRPNQAPVAAFDAAGGDLSWSFDASRSTDPDGDPLAYAWSFGDGATARGLRVSHTYAAPGTYTVQLVVTDDRGAKGTLARDVAATRPNRAPGATFDVTGAHLSWSFDGSSSSDPDGDSLTYAWTFGDGATATGAKASHAYAKAGSYTVTLAVADSRGARDVTTRSVEATLPPAAAPVRAVEAEAFTRKDAGGAFLDRAASDGRAWNLWSNGALGHSFSPGAGTFDVTVVARGDHARGWPNMELRADGRTVATWTVDSAEWKAYAARVTFAAGESKTLTVHYTNDFMRNGEDRNLRLDVIRLAPAGLAYEAEDALGKDNGKAFGDAAASGGRAWLLWSDGGLHHQANLAAGAYAVEVAARGDAALGWPVMELRLDGRTVATWTVDASTWRTYRAEVAVGEAGPKRLSVHFVNDYYAEGLDRNLRVDHVRVAGLA